VDKTPERVKEVVRQCWGMEISDAEAAEILLRAKGKTSDAQNAFGEVLCPKHTFVGWTTHGHCGGDVPLGAFGPGRPTGVFDGPEIGRITADALGVDFEQLNKRLFVDASEALAEAKVTVDKTDAANPIVKIELHGKTAELPVNKNLLRIGERLEELEGVVVYIATTQKVYLPMQAVNLIRGEDTASSATAQSR